MRKISLIYFEIGKEGEKETEKYAYFLFVCFAKKTINMEKNKSFKKKIIICKVKRWIKVHGKHQNNLVL